MKQKFMYGLAVVLGLMACGENEWDGKSPDDKGTTYVAFSLKFDGANTKAETTKPGTSEEQAVKSVWVLVADGDKIIDAGDITKNADNNGNTYVFKTTPGTHEFYAVVNPDENFKSQVSTGASIANLLKTAVALTVDGENGIASTAKGFMMASTAPQELLVRPDVSKEMLNTPGFTYNKITLRVERVTAKITVTCSEETLKSAAQEGTTGAEIGRIDRENTSYNVHKRADFSFRMDNGSQYIENQAYKGGVNADVSDKNVGTTIENAVPVYCLENLRDGYTTGQHTYMQGKSTYVTLKTLFMPKQVLNLEKLPQVELKDTPEYESPTSFPTFRVVVESGTTGFVGHYVLEDDLKLVTGYNENETDGFVLSGNGYSLTLSAPYNNGACWFGPIFVGQTDEDPERAPIERNHWYNLNIKGLKMPGKPTEPGIIETDPLVPDTHVSITLDVQLWTFENRDVDLQ